VETVALGPGMWAKMPGDIQDGIIENAPTSLDECRDPEQLVFDLDWIRGIGWIREHLADPLTVEHLADRAAMSPRHFARAFVAETGTTPAKAVERLRLETARAAVETSHAPLEHIAEVSGFGDPGRMCRAFVRAFGLRPQALRRTARA
jgi:transcriptional regulator GlxA family with amidase domain